MKKILISILLILYSSSFCFSAPDISGVSGTIVDGGSVTVTGTDFSANNAVGTTSYQQMDALMEAGTVGQTMNSDWGALWNDYYPVADNESSNSVYDNSYAHTGTKSISLKAVFDTPDNTCNPAVEACRYKGNFRHTLASDITAKVYISSWVRYTDENQCSKSGCQWKIWRMNYSGVPTDSDTTLYQTIFSTTGQRELHAFATSGVDEIPDPPRYLSDGELPGDSTVGIEDKWVRMEYQVEMSSNDVSDGTVQYWFHNPNVGVKNPINLIGNQKLRNSETFYKYIMFGHVYDEPNMQIWYDNITIQIGTYARFEIADTLNWADRTWSELQTYTASSDTQATLTLVQGDLLDDTQYYLFAIDGDGVVSDEDTGTVGNQGYPVTFGAAPISSGTTTIDPTGTKVVQDPTATPVQVGG